MAAPGPTEIPISMLYVPPMSVQEASDEAVFRFASRLAGALDHAASSPKASFRVESAVESTRKGLGENRLMICKIFRCEPDGKEWPAVNVYKLDYHDTMQQQYEQASSAWRTAATFFEFIGGFLRLGLSLCRSRSLDTRSILQLLVAFVLWLSMGVYLVMLVLAFSTVLAEHFESESVSFLVPAQISELIQVFVLGASLLAALLPARFKAEVVGTGASYVRTSHYLSINHQRSAILGRFHSAIEHIAETAVQGSPIHVFGYSFGSIIALDALFPPRAHVRTIYPRLSQVTKLVTVGCPFDFIRSLWPKYFSERTSTTALSANWINVYSPPDALGSNFRDDDSLDVPTVKIGEDMPHNLVYESREFGFVETLNFVALRAHGIYWSQTTDEQDLGCLRELVPVQFSGTAALA
jgi:hypothetical protein